MSDQVRHGPVSPHNVDWEAIRAEWETNPKCTLRGLAAKHKIPEGTMLRRSHQHKWAKYVPVAQRAASSITAAANRAIEKTCEAVARRVEERTAQTLRELEPWIEEQRAVHVRHIVGLSRKGLARLEKLYTENGPEQPKDEQFLAAAMEKHDGIIRRNLGMGDNGTGSTSLNVAVLVGGGRHVIEAGSGPEMKQIEAGPEIAPESQSGPESGS